MARLSKIDKTVISERLAVQSVVVEKFGYDAIKEAMQRLCLTCQRYKQCTIYPITTMGEDCPYYMPVNPD